MNLVRQHPFVSFSGVAFSTLVSVASFKKGTPWYFHQLANLELGKDLLSRRQDSPAVAAFVHRKTILIKGINLLSNRKIIAIPFLLIGILACKS